MSQRAFGGEHTTQKLRIIENYLGMFSTALKNQPFDRIYIDAFAGSGEVPSNTSARPPALFQEFYESEKQAVLMGSAQRAMDLRTPFQRYVFIDKKRSNITELKERFSPHHRFNKCEFHYADANTKLKELCKSINWNKNRAVVFLDPFGNQVAWDTIKALAETKAIDLWYLFPSGTGVCRQVSKKGKIHETHIKSLISLFGSQEILSQLATIERENDLFGERDVSKRTATVESVTKLMISQMKNIFPGGVLDKWVPLGKSRNHPLYSLIFAWANPSPEASNLARKFAKTVLKGVSEN